MGNSDNSPKPPLGSPIVLSGLPAEMKEILDSLSLPGEDWSQTRWPPPLAHLEPTTLARLAVRLRSLTMTLRDLEALIRAGLAPDDLADTSAPPPSP
jgi:hypothetical protein